MKKRILSLALSLVMLFSLTTPSAWAAPGDAEQPTNSAVNGYYDDNGNWTQGGSGSVEKTIGDSTVTLSKTATPVAGELNTYDVTLSLVTSTTVVPQTDSAATVLVIDVSGSMDYCANCGGNGRHDSDCSHYNSDWWSNGVTTEQSRMTAAKNAAKEFLNGYAGTDTTAKRWLAIVKFSYSGSQVLPWTNVATADGKQAAITQIDRLSADGGTNLDDGLYQAYNLLGSSTIAQVPAAARNVIALTDGAPTQSRSYGSGSSGSADINAETANTASNIKSADGGNAKIYTVCFGVANDYTWIEYGMFGSVTGRGPKIGDFLHDSIASPAEAASGDTPAKTYAFNADNADDLMEAFAAITESITNGLDGTGWTATDPMPGYISVSSAPSSITADGQTYTWELSDPETSTSGGTTTYTYTVTYRIVIDHTQVEEGVYYPANAPTYLTVDGEQYAFPVPGVNAVYPEYTVTYEYEGEVPAGAPAVPAQATYKYKDTVTVADAPKLEGYNFSGWSRTGTFEMPNNDVTITGSWTIRSDLEYTVNYYWNGTSTKVADSKVVSGQTFMDVVTESPIDVAGYTPVSNDSKTITIAVSGNKIDFYYYKNVEIVANSDLDEVYNGAEHSVSGYTGAPADAKFDITVGATGIEAGTYPAAFAAGVVGTVDKTAKYIIKNATDGKLIIAPLGGVVVTITENSDVKDYNGAQQSVTGYKITSIQIDGADTALYTEADFSYVGTDANKTASGTNVDKYDMNLSKDHFRNDNANFEDVTFVIVDGQLTIKPVELTITADSANKPYDGTALTDNGWKDIAPVGLKGADAVISVVVAGSQTIVGSSANVASGAVIKDNNGNDVTGNYNISYVDGTLEVTKRAVTVTAGSGTKTYDGTALTKDSAVADGLAAGDELDSFTVTGSQTVVGSSANVPSAAKIVNAKGEDVTASYDITYSNGTLTVTPKAITITADDANKIYDGTALTKDTYTSTALAAGDKIDSVTVTGSQTVVGKSDNVPSAAVINNAAGENVTASYDITYVNGELEVTKKAVTITALSDTRVYTGQPLTRDEASAEGLASGDKLDAVTVTGTITSVGTEDNVPSEAKIVNAKGEDVTASYAITYANGTLEVTKRNVKLTSGTASKEYDGEPLTKDEVSVSDEGFVTGEGASYDVTGSQTLVGSSDNTFTYELNEGTSADNYNITTEFGKLTVTDRNVKYEITVEANSASATYDGDEHTAEGFKTLTFTVEGKIYTVEGLNASVTKVSAGTYTNEITGTAVVKDANGNDVTAQFAVNEIDGKLVIDKKALTIIAGSDTKEYDGTALTKNSYTSDALADGDSFASVTVTGSQTVKGSSANEASNAVIVNADGEDVTASYDITYVNGTLEVTKKALTITADDATKPYDGKALTKDSYTNTDLAEGDSFDSVTVTGSQTVVGTSNNVPSAAVIKNTAGEDVTDSYDITYVNGTLEVTKKTITITADDATKPYDGKALTKDSYTSTDLAEGDSFDSVTVTGSQTVVGTSNNVPSAAVIKNTAGEDVTASYDITYANGTLEVTKKAITVTADDAQKIYDGEALTKNSYTADALAEGDTFASVTVTGSQTVVGSSDNVPSAAVIINAKGEDVTASYAIEYKNGTLKVTGKEVTITAEDANKTYDGEALTKDSFTNTALAKGDSIVSVTVTGSQTVVGSSENVPSAAKIVNAAGEDVTASYVVKYENGTLTVTKKAITVTAESDEKEYDGTPLTKDSYTSTDLATGDSFDSVTVTGSQTVVGTSNNVPSAAVIKNADGEDVTASYEITYANGKLEVTKRPITVQIAGNTGSKEYNGATQSVTGYVVTIEDTLYTEDKIQFSGDAVAEGIVVGTYPMGLTESQFSNDDDNFDVTFQVTDGWLKITPVAAEVIVTITGHTDTEVYDGTEHTVTGYDVTINNPLFTEKDILFSGDASVSGIYVGTYPMGLVEEQFSHENPNFAKVTFNVTDGWLEITPITAEVVITADSDDKMYDGTPLTNDGYTYDAALLIAGDTIDAVVEGTITNVGTVANKVTSHKIYRTVADTREVVDVTACYSNVVYVDGELEITPRAITMTSGSDSKKYDGTPLTATQVTETGDGFIEGEGAAYSDFASITNVGTIDNTFKYTLNEGTLAENYVITQVPGTLTINKHTDAQLVAEGYTGVYDGLNHDGVTAKDVTGDVEGDEWTYSYSTDGETYTAEMPQYKDVGTYTVYVKAENPNYEGDKLITTVPVEITPATIVVTADDHTIATGDPDPELTYQVVTPVEIETPAFSGELVREPGTAKGEYPINQGTLALADGEGFKADNYVLEYVPGTLTILQRALTVDKTVDKEKVRVGDTVTYTITVTNSGEVDLETVAVVDQMLGIEEVIGALAVGESWTKSYTYTTTEADEDKTIVNVAIAGAEGETFGSDDATTEVLPPIPDTGDHTPVTMLSVTMLLSAAGIILMLRKQRKEENA